jgi:hypothetical protein
VVLAALLSKAYTGYEGCSFSLENYESASLLASNVAESPALKAENQGAISHQPWTDFPVQKGMMRERNFLLHSQEIILLWSKSGQIMDNVSG